MNDPTPVDIGVLTPIAIAGLVALLALLVKAVMGANDLKRENPDRGPELFKLFFLGPDLAMLSLGLFISSDVLKLILNGQKLNTFYKDFSATFWTYLVISLVSILSCIFLWSIHGKDERTLHRTQVKETRQRSDGKEYEVTVWPIDWVPSLTSRAGLLILVLGNLLGVASIMSYAVFIFFGFVTR
jgi:hypothetical protein